LQVAQIARFGGFFATARDYGVRPKPRRVKIQRLSERQHSRARIATLIRIDAGFAVSVGETRTLVRWS
jgi:hypothetical protein